MTHKTSSRDLKLRALSLGIAAAIAAPVGAQSLPTGFGGATNVTAPTSDGTTMTVNVTGPRAYAEWGTFDVPGGTFFNVTSDAGVGNNYIFVNRVVGGPISTIAGTVTAGGNFWLINPAGIAVSSSGVFNVGGLLLSTATTLNGEDETSDGAAFLADATNTFTLGGATGGITIANGAALNTSSGPGAIALIADAINFGGTADAGATGQTGLIGARGVSVTFDANLDAFTTLTITEGSGSETAVTVRGGEQFTGGRTIIAAAGMTDGQGNVLLNNDAATNVTRFNGDVILYAGNSTNAGPATVLTGGALAALSPSGTGARIRTGGVLISSLGNMQVAASGGIGQGDVDLNLSAASSISINGAARGSDIALIAGDDISLTSADARDDLVVRSDASAFVATGRLRSGVTVDGLAAVDVAGAADSLAGATLSGNNIDIVSGTVGRGDFDLDLFATGAIRVDGAMRGRDIALEAGGAVSVTSGDARDDLVIRSNGITASGALRSGVTVDGLAPPPNDLAVNPDGAGDRVNGPRLSGNDMSLYGENGVVDLAVAPLVGNSYRVRGTDFAGLALAPTWVDGGFENTFVITDTAGGFTAGNLSSPGRLWIEVRNGGSLEVTGPLSSVRGDVQLLTIGGGDINLAGNVTSGARAGSVNEYLVLKSSGAINQTAGIIDTTLSTSGSLYATAANGISLTGENLFATAAFQNTGAGDIQVRNAGSFNLTTVTPDGFSPTVSGATTTSGNITIDTENGVLVNGVPVSTGAGNIAIAGPATIAGATAFTATGGTATFGGTVDGSAVGMGDLIVTATNGTTFGGEVGATSALASLTVNGGTTVNAGTVRAGAIDLDAVTIGAGAPATVTLDATTGALVAGAVTANHAGTLAARGASINLASFAGPNASLDLVASAGPIAVGPVNSGGTVSMTSTGNIGGAMPGSRADITAAGQVTIDTDGTALLGAVASTGAGISVLSNGLDATSTDASGILSLNGGTGGIALGSGSGNSTLLNTSGAVNVTGVLTTGLLVGSAGGGATLAGANQIDELGNFTASSLVLNNARALAISGVVDASAGDASIAVTGGNLQIASTGQVRGAGVDLSTDANFLNASGSDAVVASNRWVIYSAAPTGNAFDNLDSGNTAFWSATRATLAPGSVDSNRYVFAFQPTLTFTTADITKVYGTDLTGDPGLAYTITGYQPGVAGAFLADSADTVFTGTPQLASEGFAPRASVNGGPYAITIDGSSLVSSSGYAFDFSNAGSVTVTPLGITATPDVDDKTYDGSTNATGGFVLGGVLDGDDVGATATFTFFDANAGVNKQVTVDGLSLTGADAGNYTVTLSGQALADILQRSITVTANPLTKPEGSTDPALTWTITDGSLVTGESLTGSLTRESGEAPGVYDILQGTLNASSNYRLTFVGSNLTITEVGVVDPLPPQAGPMYTTSNDPTELLDTLDTPLALERPLEVIDQRVDCEGEGQQGTDCPRTQPE